MKSETRFNLVMIFFMALFLSATMSFAMVVIHVGFVDDFFPLWLGDLVIGFIVAYPVSLIALPITVKAANAVLRTGATTD